MMPTPMHVYDEIAERYGIDSSNSEAVLDFFSTKVYELPPGTQKNIAEEILLRNNEPDKNLHHNLDDDELVPLPDPSKIVRAKDSRQKECRNNTDLDDIDLSKIIDFINQNIKK